MGDKSTIEWTDATWNPVRGCVKISPGCKHCYAEVFAERWRGVKGHAYEHGFDPRLVPEKLNQPIRWRKPRKVFVNSMSDLYQDAIVTSYIDQVFGVMAFCGHHTFQVLTKRADRQNEYVNGLARVGGYAKLEAVAREHGYTLLYHGIPLLRWPIPNVWLGVSVEDRQYGVPRIEQLRQTPAIVRFLSIEPLLGDIGQLDLTGIGWVIVGAESGRGARSMNEGWARSIRDQCQAAGVPFFYKQQTVNGRTVSLPELDGRQWAEFPQRNVSA